MRVMVFHRAAADIDFTAPPTPEQIEAFAAMDAFTEELVKAGVFVAAAGLKGGADARFVEFDGAERTVVDGPYAEIKESIAGFSIWEVKDVDEAVDWVKRFPGCTPGKSVVEIRPFFEAGDLGDYVSEEDLAAPREGDRGKLGVA